MEYMGLEFDIDNKGLHPETTAMDEVPKRENLIVKRRPNPFQISIMVIEHQECENHWARNTCTSRSPGLKWPYNLAGESRGTYGE